MPIYPNITTNTDLSSSQTLITDGLLTITGDLTAPGNQILLTTETNETNFSYAVDGTQHDYSYTGQGSGFTYDSNGGLTGGTLESITYSSTLSSHGGGPAGPLVRNITFTNLNVSVAETEASGFWQSLIDGDSFIALRDPIRANTPIGMTVNAGGGDDTVSDQLTNAEGVAANGIITVDLGAGDDIINLGFGRRNFDITLGSGADTIRQSTQDFPGEPVTTRIIRDFNPAEDTVEILGTFAAQGQDVASYRLAAAQGGVMVQTTAGGVFDVIFLEGVSLSQVQLVDGVVSGTGSNPSGDDTIWGTDGDDTRIGTHGDDVIKGLAGNDTLLGLDGNDRINGGTGNDRLFGGEGDDVLLGAAGHDVILGQGGNDILYGGADNDRLYAGAGADEVYGGNYNDLIFGQGGADLLLGEAGYDTIFGGNGSDRIFGGDGGDVLLGNDGHDLIYGQQGNDTAYGGTGNDMIRGGAGNDRLFGWYGNDTLYGGIGDDVVDGGTGNDYAEGGAGNDDMIGRGGDDVLDGGAGDDYFVTGTGDDGVFMGAGNDTLLFTRTFGIYGNGHDTVFDFVSGEDRIHFEAGGMSLADVTANIHDTAAGVLIENSWTVNSVHYSESLLLEGITITELDFHNDFVFG